MKKVIAFTLILMIYGSISIGQTSITEKKEATFDIDDFKRSYATVIDADENKLSACERDYFVKFPDNFSDFVSIFGYTDDSEGFRPASLYVGSEIYIKRFFQLKTIQKDEFYTKLIKLTHNGYWQADAVSYLRQGIMQILNTSTDPFLAVLSKSPQQVIYGFWHFYFDGAHPMKEMPANLIILNETDKKMYEIMSKALKDVQTEWGDDH